MHFGILTFQMTLFDLAGPQAVLGVHGKTSLFAKSLDPVPTDTGVAVMPNSRYEDCPTNLDVLLVPGGAEKNGAFQDLDTMALLVEHDFQSTFLGRSL